MSFVHFLRIGHLVSPRGDDPHAVVSRALTVAELTAIDAELPSGLDAPELSTFLQSDGALRIRYVHLHRREPFALHVALVGHRLFGLAACDSHGGPLLGEATLRAMLQAATAR